MPNLYLMCGLPCVGKSTYIENNFKDKYVISRDTELEKYGKEKFGKNLTHRKIWLKLTKAEKIKISDITYQKIKDYAKQKKDIVIDMMLLTKEKRKNIIDMVTKDYNVTVICLYADTKELLKRNKKRYKETGKLIKEEILSDLAKKLEVPTIDEHRRIKKIIIIKN